MQQELKAARQTEAAAIAALLTTAVQLGTFAKILAEEPTLRGDLRNQARTLFRQHTDARRAYKAASAHRAISRGRSPQ